MPTRAQMSHLARRALRNLLAGVVVVLAVAAALLLARAWRSRSLPDLERWHTVQLEGELEAGRVTASFSLRDYLALEDALFAELEQKVVKGTPGGGTYALCRYNAGSPASPGRFERDFNRTFEIAPEEPVGTALLLHGLTDSPYSMRAVADVLARRGFHVLALRIPGHGTVPAAIARTYWRDWLAAVRLGARHCRERAGPGRPFVIAGYSNGGALALIYTLEALDDQGLARPDRLLLFSPDVGITSLAALGDVLQAFAFVPGLEKSRWAEICPEYDPFKYTSFPLHAAEQTSEMERFLHERLAADASAGRLSRLPPILTFQSAADATVLVEDTVQRLYARLPRNGSELVLFDVNRLGAFREFFRSPPHDLVARLEAFTLPGCTVTVVTNRDQGSREVVARTRPEGGGPARVEDLGVQWPTGVYSLSHLAVPFRPDDPLYGTDPPHEGHRYHLGNLVLRGERDLLTIPVDALMRLRCNPFFGYMERRIQEAVTRDLDGPARQEPAAGPP